MQKAKWVFFLHFYQPPTQEPSVVESISQESYSKILNLFEKYPKAKVVLNINASLTEQLAPTLISKIKQLAEQDRLEFTGSAAYHPMLSRLPKSQIKRQIELNTVINKKFFGERFNPRGFFPPEMDYSAKVGTVIRDLGFEWVLLDDMGFGQHLEAPLTEIFCDVGSGLGVFFRDETLSLDIAFNKITKVKDVKKLLFRVNRAVDGFFVTAMDAETFGHHHPSQLTFLEEILKQNEFELVTTQDVLSQNYTESSIDVKSSTWGEGWERWDNPENKIHKLQWELFDLAVSCVGDSGDITAQGILDKAIHSDQFWWASHKPCWHYGMVKKGAKLLFDAVSASKSELIPQAQMLYDNILNTGTDLYGQGIVLF